MRRSRYDIVRLILLFLLAVSTARAEEARVFVERRSDGGELKYINDLPVLIVSGTPAEIGRQKGVLTAAAVKKIADYPRRLLERSGRKDRLEMYRRMCDSLAAQLPDDHREELLAASERMGIDRDLGLLANMLPDIYRGGFACSSLIVDAKHSKTDGPLFGRNLDFYTLGILDKYSLATVHRPKGKHAFVSIGFPGLFGCVSGMNDAGLALAVHEVFLSRDGATMFNPKGVPYTFSFRRVLEECTSVEEAEKMLRATERTTILSLALCDPEGGIVLEMTPKTVVARRGIDGICACTNHFRSDELAVFAWCSRYRKLIHSRTFDQLGIPEVAEKLHQVHLGRLTVQTMIFEPAELKLHLAIGSCPSSALPLKLLELKPLFTP
ncbi:MAG: C45 family peptidase [Planctomycetes bacterium]|nr:C45 family peptidase [Planctomycetota bacterium]MCG2685018.1 C45 family peptidase [Planctomycetales bacterium]